MYTQQKQLSSKNKTILENIFCSFQSYQHFKQQRNPNTFMCLLLLVKMQFPIRLMQNQDNNEGFYYYDDPNLKLVFLECMQMFYIQLVQFNITHYYVKAQYFIHLISEDLNTNSNLRHFIVCNNRYKHVTKIALYSNLYMLTIV